MTDVLIISCSLLIPALAIECDEAREQDVYPRGDQRLRLNPLQFKLAIARA
jgi:hypothetical protein